MSVIESLILGLIQGLTEFLPVSSSGHLELAKALLGSEALPQRKPTCYGNPSFRYRSKHPFLISKRCMGDHSKNTF